MLRERYRCVCGGVGVGGEESQGELVLVFEKTF